MVLAAAVRAESCFPFSRVLFFYRFCHCDHPSLWKIRQHYLKESSAAQVPGKIVMRASSFITAENRQNRNGKLAAVHGLERPAGAVTTLTLTANDNSPSI